MTFDTERTRNPDWADEEWAGRELLDIFRQTVISQHMSVSCDR